MALGIIFIVMKNIIFLTLLVACSSSKLYLNQEQGSLYTTEQLRRNPSDGFKVKLKASIYKKLPNDFYLLKDSKGLILAKIKAKYLFEDTSYNSTTLFEIIGETDNESAHFHIKVEGIEFIKD